MKRLTWLAVFWLIAAVGIAANFKVSNGSGKVYYISPVGSDANNGLTPNTPKLTWAAYFKNPPTLLPGDTLIAMDGQYTTATNGNFVITCSPVSPTGNNGSPDWPITIKAQHERKAQILGNGLTHVMNVLSCSNIVLQGLWITGQDGTAGNWTLVNFEGLAPSGQLSSSSSVTIGTPPYTFTVAAGALAFQDHKVRVWCSPVTGPCFGQKDANGTFGDFVEGIASAPNDTTLTVTASLTSGSGTFTSWQIGTWESGNMIVRSLLDHSIRLANNSGITNTQMILLSYNQGTTIENNELYYFDCRGMQAYRSNGNFIRLNYLNPRGYNQKPDGTGLTTANEMISIYPGQNNIVENNFLDGSAAPGGTAGCGFPINGEDFTIGNKYWGNAVLKSDCASTTPNARAETLQFMPQNTEFHHLVTIQGKGGAQLYDNYLQNTKNTLYDHCTFQTKSGVDGAHFRTFASDAGDGASSYTFTSSYFRGAGTAFGFFFEDPVGNGQTGTATVTNVWLNGYSTALSPAASDAVVTYTNTATTDPAPGSCYLWLPDAAAGKGQGVGGTDLGATILYRTVQGVTYSGPANRLWDITTAAPRFRGATVVGLNDHAGDSLFDMAVRFHVGVANGCAFPSGY